MDWKEVDEILERTLDDDRLSRSERKALSAVLADRAPDGEARGQLRRRVFEAARRRAEGDARKLVDWLEDVMKVAEPLEPAGAATSDVAEACFSPGEACRQRITGLLDACRESADICVFTITDNTIARAIVDTHRRGVRVRVVTDDDKSEDLGSDVERLVDRGIPLVMDRSPYHMHHKFALFDQKVLLTGSYNWTRGAAEQNEENLVVTSEPRLVRAFQGEFDALWAKFGG